MSNVLRIAIVDPDDHSRDTLKAILLSMETVWLEADCSRYEFFPDIVEQTTPDVGIVTLDSDEQKATDLLQRLSRDFHETILLAASSSTDGQLILRAMRSGAKEFLTLPLSDDELSEALGRISASRFGDENKKSRSCQTIAVCGVTGGVGTTSIATNMGAMLAATEDSSVALVDLDLALGDADVFLDAIPDYTLADVTQNISRLDIQLLKRSLTKHASGLYLLPRPVDLHDTTLIDEDNFLKVIALLKASFSHLIIDLSKTYNLVDLVVLKNADHIILVTQLDLPCLRNIVRLMMSFEEIEGLVDRVKIVVNRAGLDSGQISLKKA
ncbi:MAG: AAA family ATPase, partial [Planctomycetota bacterium]